jgi:hypothetical protein
LDISTTALALQLVPMALSKIASTTSAKVATLNVHHVRVARPIVYPVTLLTYFLDQAVSHLVYHPCTMYKATAAKCALVLVFSVLTKQAALAAYQASFTIVHAFQSVHKDTSQIVQISLAKYAKMVVSLAFPNLFVLRVPIPPIYTATHV